GDTLEADICVVGTGAAGIPLALKLAHTPLRVLLLESGGLTADRDGPPLYRVVDDDSPRLVNDTSRRWFFGGNTNHWFGNCRPLDAADFTPRDWIPYSGWPLRTCCPTMCRRKTCVVSATSASTTWTSAGLICPIKLQMSMWRH
ncbi:MAG: hypothetical protein ACRDL7_14930, partial [Gaiellaceae bacterium]